VANPISRRSFLQLLGASGLALATCTRFSRSTANVVCILIDQLRKEQADQWLLTLNKTAAEGGVRLDQMRAVAPWTYPSVISMMSGLYPQQHGADGHLHADFLTTFDRSLPLVQQRLRSVGYRTAGFVANPFLHTWNSFHEGFDHYDISFVHSVGNRRGLEAAWKPEHMFANSVNAAIVEYFDRQPHEAPEFTYVHYMDVHGPWDRAPFPDTYQQAILYIDKRVHEIYDYFMKRYEGNLLFFVTSDHGRSLALDLRRGFGPEWRKNKTSVHDFNLRIPFMVLPSQLVQQPRVSDEPCSNVDFVPTLLDWLELKLRYPSPGISLVPAIHGQMIDGRNRPIYARHSAFGAETDCIVLSQKKYMRFFDTETGRVIAQRAFDLVKDPHETETLGEEFGEADALLAEAAGTHGVAYSASYDELSPEVRERLRALGYLK
jgi:arylsulfatase A-like enzyme